jgi:pimeloyl-ACP methyl ester carboxylesterase
VSAEIIAGRPDAISEPAETKPSSRERVIRDGGVEIATEAFGDPANPCVLLIMGAMASMLWWPEEFCRRLAAQKFYVIRYDNRDTGLSTTYEPGQPSYTSHDMVADAIRILDGYGIRSAHVVGMSAGGMIAQHAALEYPERVASLTVISTSPVGTDTSHLPQTTDAYSEHSAAGATIDWSDRAQVIDYMARDARMLAGTAHPHDEEDARKFIARDYDRAKNFASATNHFLVEGGDQKKDRLQNMRAPLLVIHGTADPIFPIEHGVALAEAVDGARLVRLEGGGHELHRNDWAEIIASIVEHTSQYS